MEELRQGRKGKLQPVFSFPKELIVIQYGRARRFLLSGEKRRIGDEGLGFYCGAPGHVASNSTRDGHSKKMQHLQINKHKASKYPVRWGDIGLE